MVECLCCTSGVDHIAAGGESGVKGVGDVDGKGVVDLPEVPTTCG
jgi:hypothetical protein